MIMTDVETLVEVKNLSVSFPAKDDSRTIVVDRANLDIRRNEILGLVGESGSGKTVTSTAIMRLTRHPGRIEGGEIWSDGRDLLKLPEEQMRKLRGEKISMIFQNPRSTLNPLMRVGRQMSRVFQLHRDMSDKEAEKAAIGMLKMVGITDAERRMRSYPHQLSGGMCQRVMIGMMLASEPELLIADEPTTGLDVTIQAQIFELIKDLQRRTQTSVLLITHDLGVVAETCHRVAVMHGGHVVEIADVSTIFNKSRHPYTKQLLGSVLRVDKKVEPKTLQMVGEDILYSSFACRYANKCSDATDVCRETRPDMVEVAPGHTVMCHVYGRNDAAANS